MSTTKQVEQAVTTFYPFKLHVIVDSTPVATVIVHAFNMVDAMNIAKNAVAFTPADNLIPTIMLEGDN